ncbi:uncharacterized protein LOC101451138 isoform X1 [Ceratitis capitata]|uniref:uncharacterized protein LOC101451138 isoform X1 n=1 Tax=Ceratitis capitata TaxID=7213 RepID=UPI000A11F767|nr:uncharacterized protein LOC101451138 isoform X1 [Ceratitis capitata]XP_020714303.1 uncharacterized protein LOC101451138 isoform X1 [Ceratitis capitata]XP_020714304.1 uncharacterized protein LOC101451138 isoform X1 [Ceratitis capitata]
MNLLTILICLLFGVLVDSQIQKAAPNQSILLSNINQETFKLISSGNRDNYHLRLDLPEGGFREENAEVITDENGNKLLAVKGHLDLVYNDAPFQVVVIYEADGNGYRAKYMYVPKRPGIQVQFASASFLKTAAG